MGNHMTTPMAVHSLTHQYARLAGQIQVLQERNCRLQGFIDEKARRVAEAKTKIAILAKQMEALRTAALTAFNTDISLTEARQTRANDHIASWGAVTRAILRQLSLANRMPLTTAELSILIDRDLDLDDSGLSKLKQKLRYRLKALRLHGLVVRTSSRQGIGEYSTWVIADTAN
jgi:plasmid stability protein